MIIRALGKPDEFDFTTAVTLFSDIEVKSVTDLVEKTKQKCPKRELQELAFFGHGGNGQFVVGNDRVGGITKPGQDPLYKLAPLAGLFYSTAALILCVCEGGRNEALLTEIARTINAPVYGCKGDVLPILGFPKYGYWKGQIVGAFPDGRITSPSSIPDPPIFLA